MQKMVHCTVSDANPFQKAAVASSDAKDDGLLLTRQLMKCILVWLVSSGFARNWQTKLLETKKVTQLNLFVRKLSEAHLQNPMAREDPK